MKTAAAVLMVMMVSVVGCYSPYTVTDEFQNEKKNLVVVTKDTEIRSLFGTNGGGDVWELCELPAKKVLWYSASDFTHCLTLAETHPLYALLHHKQSRGAGPEIVGSLILSTSMGTSLAVSRGANAAANASASATNTAIQTVGKHRR